ncbi:hypothetical protein N8I77_013679 [Diaporthe amygdali]|uniref:Uncharacterized protein n=1 Tax=Phomopsis amygdali TaxID=1214568 RepID=A0AAD9S1S4_PHOAM|nr:hypothetical protein N8I77_013679 [Diaporthe amygdali]
MPIPYPHLLSERRGRKHSALKDLRGLDQLAIDTAVDPMACKDVGSTNSDIAGLGILLSFIIQGGLSFLLSLCTVFIDWRLEGFQGMWADYWSHSGGTFSSGRNDQQLAIAQQVSNRSIVLSGKAQNHLRSMRDLINRLLGTISDAQTLNGIALLVSAIAQYNTLELYHFHIVYDTVNFTGQA